jgi:hypothetical protein
VKLPLAYLGGIKSLANAEHAIAERFECVVLARALLHDPALVNKLQSGKLTKSGCDNCDGCVAYIYLPAGTRCVYNPPNDPTLNLAPASSINQLPYSSITYASLNLGVRAVQKKPPRGKIQTGAYGVTILRLASAYPLCGLVIPRERRHRRRMRCSIDHRLRRRRTGHSWNAARPHLRCQCANQTRWLR